MEDDLKKALTILRDGGIILYPTDTVWGIGCDATNPDAVAKVMALKGRPDAKSMLVLVGSDGMLQRFVPEIPEAAWQLIDVTDTPLTIVYDHVNGIASALRAEDGSTGVRITSEQFSRALCTRLGRPIVSTSANFSGRPTPSNFSEIDPDLISKVDYTVKYRREEKGHPSPSGIIKVSKGDVIKVIR